MSIEKNRNGTLTLEVPRIGSVWHNKKTKNFIVESMPGLDGDLTAVSSSVIVRQMEADGKFGAAHIFDIEDFGHRLWPSSSNSWRTVTIKDEPASANMPPSLPMTGSVWYDAASKKLLRIERWRKFNSPKNFTSDFWATMTIMNPDPGSNVTTVLSIQAFRNLTIPNAETFASLLSEKKSSSKRSLEKSRNTLMPRIGSVWLASDSRKIRVDKWIEAPEENSALARLACTVLNASSQQKKNTVLQCRFFQGGFLQPVLPAESWVAAEDEGDYSSHRHEIPQLFSKTE
jgi:hypothetical protein